MVSHALPEQPMLLTSWKEIANYLGKGVRTVQRWELQYGLPVRRPNEKAKGVVHATREELDRWLDAEWSQRTKTAPPIPRKDESDENLLAVRSNIRQSSQLRLANRLLMESMRASLSAVYEECCSLARSMGAESKAQ